MTGRGDVIAFVATCLSFAASGCGVSTDGAPTLLVNETLSAPRGLYVRTQADLVVGQRVAITQPTAARPYLEGLGVAPGVPLLKRIVATEGQAVCSRGGRLEWPGGAAAVLRRDRAGRLLPEWRGCRLLRRGELLLVGDTPLSFDSRYFGPAPATSVLGAYREVLTW